MKRKKKTITDLAVRLGRRKFKNPVWVASGTFGSGVEFQDFIDFRQIGAVITKTVTLRPRQGNAPPRIVETSSGMLNSIGLENKGIDAFLEEQYPELKARGADIIISISGKTQKEFTGCAEKLSMINTLAGIELNLSCPNVEHGSTRFRLLSQDPGATRKVVSSIRKLANCPVIAKLTPEVTDIAEIACAAEKGGADAVSLVNSYPGMAVDACSMKPVLGNISGGLTGPAIKPLALKAVWDTYRSVNIPVIGIGGIMTGRDVAEFMLCGATAVQVGTANLVDPDAYKRILAEFLRYLEEMGIDRARALTGALKA